MIVQSKDVNGEDRMVAQMRQCDIRGCVAVAHKKYETHDGAPVLLCDIHSPGGLTRVGWS